jgi:pimeloyl-ACP methyl ester carboxylesterase
VQQRDKILRIRRPARASSSALALLLVAAATACGATKPKAPAAVASLAYDRRAPLDVQHDKRKRWPVDRPSRPIGLDVSTFTYESDGQRVPAIMARPLARESTGCLIWENGLLNTKEDSVVAWEGAGALGLTTFSIDLRDHGARAASRQTLDKALKDPQQVYDIVRGSAIDLRRGVDYLESKSFCKHNIALVGGSLGGIIGAAVVGSDPRIKVAALLSVPGTWRELLTQTDLILPGIEKGPKKFQAALDLLQPFDPVQWVARISPRPLLLTRGDSDPIVSAAAFEDLAAAALQPVEVQTYAGGHNPFGQPDVTPGVARSNAAALTDFLRRQLTRSSSVSGD